MKKPWVVAVFAVLAVALVAILVIRFRQPAETAATIDLVALFPEAEKRTTMASLHDGFSIQDVTIQDVTRHCIFAIPHSRIIYKLRIPENAEFRAWAALRQEAWTHKGDGAGFRVGVSDGKRYEELVRIRLNPFVRAEDRRWMPVTADLSAYAGQTVDLILNTDPIGDPVHDAALWGAPALVVRK